MTATEPGEKGRVSARDLTDGIGAGCAITLRNRISAASVFDGRHRPSYDSLVLCLLALLPAADGTYLSLGLGPVFVRAGGFCS